MRIHRNSHINRCEAKQLGINCSFRFFPCDLKWNSLGFVVLWNNRYFGLGFGVCYLRARGFWEISVVQCICLESLWCLGFNYFLWIRAQVQIWAMFAACFWSKTFLFKKLLFFLIPLSLISQSDFKSVCVVSTNWRIWRFSTDLVDFLYSIFSIIIGKKLNKSLWKPNFWDMNSYFAA